MNQRINANVVPISRARGLVRHAPPPGRLTPVATRSVRARGRQNNLAQIRVTPAWVCIVCLIGVTMWPSAVVLLAKLALHMFGG
jgi:hypothetical protein